MRPLQRPLRSQKPHRCPNLLPSQHRLPWKQCQPPQRLLLNPPVFLCQQQPSLNRPQCLSPDPTVPLPASTVALPEVVPTEVEEPTINVESEKQVAKATQDAFSGAFSSELIPEPEPASEAVPTPDTALPVAEEEPEFVSAAEHFIAADEDGSGALDVEELAQATGTSLEEAAELHAEADTDGDGVVTLSEFIASPAAEKTASLPKPVAPSAKKAAPTATKIPDTRWVRRRFTCSSPTFMKTAVNTGLITSATNRETPTR